MTTTDLSISSLPMDMWTIFLMSVNHFDNPSKCSLIMAINSWRPRWSRSDDSLNRPRLGRGLVRCDLNHDGRSDFVVTEVLGPTSLWINRGSSHHHWVGLHLVGTQSERDAIGAHVIIQAADSTSHHWVTGGDGYLSRNDAKLCIGLGETSQIESITVEWPSGSKQTFSIPATDAYWLLVEGEPQPYSEQ